LSDTPDRLRRRRFDRVLLVPALLLVLVDDVVWAHARRALRLLGALPALRRAQAALAALPAWLALTLFLIPEAASHVGSLVATVLLVQRHLVAAALCYAASKLFATLLAVWIYQGCAATLLRVAWFARAHGWVMAVRDWGAPALRRAGAGGVPGTGRLRALRRRLARRLVGRG
jgi:hypothetical protein